MSRRLDDAMHEASTEKLKRADFEDTNSICIGPKKTLKKREDIIEDFQLLAHPCNLLMAQ